MASAWVHGEALLFGQRPEVMALGAELRALSESYPDAAALRAECAGIIAGSWFAEGIKISGASVDRRRAADLLRTSRQRCSDRVGR